jgi:hypothetical protein
MQIQEMSGLLRKMDQRQRNMRSMGTPAHKLGQSVDSASRQEMMQGSITICADTPTTVTAKERRM